VTSGVKLDAYNEAERSAVMTREDARDIRPGDCNYHAKILRWKKRMRMIFTRVAAEILFLN